MDRAKSVHRWWARRVLLLAVGALSAGCGGGDSDGAEPASASSVPATARTWVGTMAGTDAFVAVVFDGTRALAYACDGVPSDSAGTTPSVQAWFNGPVDGTLLDLRQAGAHLRLDLDDEAITGSLVLADGQQGAVTGRVVDHDAGLYRAEPSGSPGKAVAGWILAADGRQRGGLQFDGGKTSGTTLLDTTQLTFSFQQLSTARISKVGITPIPIP